MLGSAGIIVMDETTCMVWAARNLLYFYKHESCGKCTPCREGGDWLHKILTRIENGEGEMRDIDLLVSVGNNIAGKTLCAFGDAAATPALTTVKNFRAEFEAHVREGRCTAAEPTGAPRGCRWRRTDACNTSIPNIVAHLGLIFVVFNLLVLSAAFMVWLERKVCAYIQDRVGPNRVGYEGALQPFADVIKLLFKEELRPKAADALLFAIAPIISAGAAFAAFSVDPVRHRDDAVRPAGRAAAAAGHRRQRRGAGDLRDHLDGHLRHRPRRLELEQQVLAARRAALVGADDQLRAVLRAGAGRGDHAGRVAVAARDRAWPSRATGGASSRSGTSSCSRSAS